VPGASSPYRLIFLSWTSSFHAQAPELHPTYLPAAYAGNGSPTSPDNRSGATRGEEDRASLVQKFVDFKTTDGFLKTACSSQIITALINNKEK